MFYVTHYNRTSKSGPEEGGWYTEGWLVDWSEPCETEEDAIKLLGDYYKEFYGAKEVPEDLDASFEDYDDLFIIEDEANRGHLHGEAPGWDGDEDYSEEPVFDSNGKAHFPEREKRQKTREDRYNFIKKVKSIEEYTKDKKGGENAPKIIFVLDDNIKGNKLPIGFIFTGRNISEETSKKFIEDLLKDNDINFEYDMINFADVNTNKDANSENVASISVNAIIPELNESLNKFNESLDEEELMVCDHCLMGIESHEGRQLTSKDIPEDRLYEVETISEYSGEPHYEMRGICDWCDEEFSEDELNMIKENIKEDTVKKANGKWVNRGDTGEEHGEFKTKKAADAQRRAIWVNWNNK